MLIFITGYMGAGKTTQGKRLAESLKYNFYDLDELIETATGCSITDYFEKFGEDAFRQKEREILFSHLDDRMTVIATGGGTPCFSDNMELMNRSGITVFINASVDTIIQRLTGNISDRPLLKNVIPEKLPLFIMEHLKGRQEFYLRAKITVDEEVIDLDLLIDNIRSHSPASK